MFQVWRAWCLVYSEEMPVGPIDSGWHNVQHWHFIPQENMVHVGDIVTIVLISETCSIWYFFFSFPLILPAMICIIYGKYIVIQSLTCHLHCWTWLGIRSPVSLICEAWCTFHSSLPMSKGQRGVLGWEIQGYCWSFSLLLMYILCYLMYSPIF